MSRPSRRLLSAVGGVAALALVLASCGSSTPAADPLPVPAGLPPAQALPGSGGTWATLTMGHRDDPLNTFGELFHRAGCGASGCGGVEPPWTLATPPGVASNGGIMIAADADGSLTAGFGVSLALRFSPLATTTDAGSVWSGGILPVALAPEPDALATSGPTQRLALAAPAPVGSGGVLVAGSDLSTWSRLAARGAVAAAASSAGCALGTLTAVAVTGSGADLVAGECSGGGRAGIFRIGASGHPVAVTATGPPVPTPAGTVVGTLRLVSGPGGLSALVADGSGSGTRLQLATSTDDAATWTVAAPFAAGGPVVSTAVDGSGGFVVLVGRPRGVAAAVVAPGTGWRTLPAPPTGTAVIAPADPGGSLQALVPSGSTLDVDQLGPTGWSPVQALDVPVQYGSTSAGQGSAG